MSDLTLILKIVGAVVTFALGIWIGLGMPGLKRSERPREWQASDRLRATWINRVFFRMDRSERRFGSGLIAPGGRPKKPSAAEGEGEADAGESSSAVRLRRTAER